jgi:Uma2 family endonuclease
MRVYAREGVRHVWLVDPLAQTLEVYVAADGAWLRSQIAQGAEKIRAEPFAELELELAALWER